MEVFRDWFTRFTEWVRYEPVRASEQVRVLLLAITGMLGVAGNDPIVVGVMGVVTAVFSIWASKRTRNTVMPMRRVESDYVRQEMTEDEAEV